MTCVDTKFDQGLGYVARCMGCVWLSYQLAACITNTTYALVMEYRRWLTPNIRIGSYVYVCVYR